MANTFSMCGSAMHRKINYTDEVFTSTTQIEKGVHFFALVFSSFSLLSTVSDTISLLIHSADVYSFTHNK
jgi:hypothetical protein